MERVYLHWKKAIDQCWRLHELASWGRVDHLVLEGGAKVDHQVQGHGTTFQCELGSYVHRVHCADAGMGGGGVPEAYRIGVDPCMDLLEIRRLQSRR
jgi:hypothetical protein